MHDALRRIIASSDRWLDGALGAIILIVCVEELALAAPLGTALTVGVAAVDVLGALAVMFRRRRPLSLTLAFAAACFFPGLVIGSRWVNAPSDAPLLVTVILAYTVGACISGVPALIGLLALCVGSSGGDFSDPIVIVVFTVPAWFAGTAIRSRAQLTAQLGERAAQLQQEHDAYAREAVRYERARIARDLHDIVAHNLSMIVVQAGAGRRALPSSPATAAESLAHIEDGAVHAEREIARLTDLLADHRPKTDVSGLQALNELIRRAAAAGLAVSCTYSRDAGAMEPTLADTAFHVTQEGITNALKHAPGAPISVTVHAEGGKLSVIVENGPPGAVPTGLEQTGGNNGIAGLRARVSAAGGDISTGPDEHGGWRLAVDIPNG
jgi:signal transduction histidine kinase